MLVRAWRSLFLVLLVSGSWVVLSAEESLACSCAVGEPRDALAESDAAFVGSLLERTEGGPSIPYWGDWVATFRFAISDDLKGNLGEEIEIVTSADGASCGLEVAEGRRVGLFVTRTDNGVWTSGLCSQIDPDVLLRAASPLPEPDGVGPVRLIVGGSFGEVRVMALDDQGRTLAYGSGSGDVYDIDVCPEGERMVESLSDNGVGSLVVRDVATLAVVRDVPIVETKFPSIYEVECLDREGERLVAIDDVGPNLRVHVVEGERAEIVFEGRGRAWGNALVPGYAEIVLRGGEFGRVDLGTGEFESILRLPAHTEAARLSPDGRWVAAVRYGGALEGEPPSDVVLIPVDGGPIVTHPLVFWNDSGRVEWLDDGRLLFMPAGEDVDRIAIFDVPSFDEVVGANDWYFIETAVADGVTYGVGNGVLAAVALGEDDAASMIRTFDGPVFAIDAVPGAVEADPLPSPEVQPPTSEANAPLERPAPASDGMVPPFVLIGGAAALATIGMAFIGRRRARRSS